MQFIIRRKILVAMLFTAITMLGVFSYKQLPVELFPNTQIPYLFVQVASTLETDPGYMETQAIIPIEGAIATLSGVDKIESSADQQQGIIQISYNPDTDIKFAYLKLIEKIDAVKTKIPAGFYVQVFKFDIEQLNNMLMTIQVRGGGGADRVREVVNREVLNRIKNVNGVANVAVFGGREKTVEIELKEDVCKAYAITPADIQSALSSNSRARTFAGKVTKDNRLVFVNVVSEFSDLDDIRNLLVKQTGQVRLADVAEIRFGFKKQDSYSRVNGKEAVTMQLTRDTQSNLIDLSHRVQDQIKILNKELSSKDVEIVIEQNSADVMEKNLDLIIRLALVGGLLAVFILWIFLKNIRLVIAIGLAIPISVYTAFNLFYAFGISINSLTLLGMALAIGMLLDNSVVVMENIYRLASQGIDTDKAVIQGTSEVWRSIFAATLTTIMVFLPFAFSRNFLVGVLGKHIGISIVSTLMISLAVAMILVPMITHTLLGKTGKSIDFSRVSFHNRLIQVYRVLLKTCMRNPAGTILGALGVFFLMLLISLGVSFISTREPEIVNLTLYTTLPGGTTLENTDLLVADVEKRLETLKERKDILSQVYEEEAIVTISLQKNFENIRNYSLPKIKQEVMNSLSGLEPAGFSWDPPVSGRRFGENTGGGDVGMEALLGIGNTVEKVVVKGENYDQLVTQANLVKYYLSQQQAIEAVYINLPSTRPEVLLDLDKHLMSSYDIQASAILSQLNTFPHEFSSGTKFKQGTEEYDIQIRTDAPENQPDRNLNDLKQLPVRGSNASLFELQQIAGFRFTSGVPAIIRINQQKQLEITYNFINEVSNDKDLLTAARLEVETLLQNITMPSGIAVEIIHEQQDLSDFRFLILAAFILIYMILASVFESFTKPVVLMFSIPLAAIGSLAALILTGTSLLNANTLTGFIILIGIVVNNSIILLDYSNVLMARGYRPSRSLMMAGLARVRPILITSITTIIALFPLAMGKAEYVTDIGTPFAITVIGGLGISTLLTLVFIPTMNTGLQSALRWIYSQRVPIKLLILLIYILGGFLIFTEVDKLVWRIIDFILLIILLPATIYFVGSSLRKTSVTLIGESVPLFIHVRNLVKIYDRDTRFVREWKSGLKTRERLGLKKNYSSWRDFDYLAWQLPMAGFMVYFIYFYIGSGFWYFVLPILLYAMILGMIKPMAGLAGNPIHNVRKWIPSMTGMIYKVAYWGLPAFLLYLFYAKYKLIGLLIPCAILWYLVLTVLVTSEKLYREKINIQRLTGRFKGLRKAFYNLVLHIPVIGKRKIPFKALRGVSFDIQHGMFGLLGPNGAGKSTLMRIICGILEPSYGQITINGIDTREKREELQGLIGYLPQEFGMYENLTALEFLNYMGILKKLNDPEIRRQRVDYVLHAVHMYPNRNEKISSFSGGMKQRIGIAQILMHLPRILVVDEPTAGLDPRERIRFRNLLVELSKERIVLFSTHIIEDVASSCNQVAVIKDGLVKYLGEPVQMARIAEGKIWSVDLTMHEFEQFKELYTIIHHMRDGDNIRIRCMAEVSPSEKARQVRANLEDAYLYLLHKKV